MVWKRVVALAAFDVRMKDHVVAALAAPGVNLESAVVFAQRRDDVTVSTPLHWPVQATAGVNRAAVGVGSGICPTR